MKKILFILAASLMTLTACNKQQAQPEVVYSVDEVYAQGESLVGDTILVEGNCLHLCKHGGKKAFLRSSEEGEFIRANAVEFDSFAGECVNNEVRVRGILRAIEVPVEQPKAEEQPKEEVKAEEEHHHEGEEACGVCSTVKKYYLDALSYEIVVAE